jgi:anaerobic selenocysteine-containing dehydrogenase
VIKNPAKLVHCVCPLDCPDTCSMIVTVEDGRATELRGNKDHAFTRGFLCQKMDRYLDRVYAPDRLLHPLKRVGRKGEGRFEPISWQSALDLVADRFREIAASQAGPQAILPYSYYGTMGKLQSSSLDRRFFHRLGASMLDRTICATAGGVGYEFTLGRGRLGADPMGTPECRLILNWGSNTANTNSHLWSLMIEARKRGAKLVAIDPYKSPTARRCDWHIPIRPGTDAALALGMMHILFRDGLEDRDFLDRGTIGAAALRDRVLTKYPPERVAAITSIPVEDIEQLARLYGTTAPTLIRVNYGLQRHGGGGMAVRTIVCLPALTGAWRHWGGGALLSTSGAYDWNVSGLTRPDLSPAGTRTINMNQLGDALAGRLPGPPIHALYVYNSNPAAVTPDQSAVRKGLVREDLFTVVHEQFATDTADYADLVLPATTQLEHLDIHGSYGHHEVMLNFPAIEPPGECRSNNDVFRALAARLEFESELFPDDETLIREALDGGPTLRGIALEKLQETPSIRMNIPDRFVPFAAGRFPTPSGKCELFSQSLADAGFDPLPTYTPPHEDPHSNPLAGRFPLQLVSPPRPQFLNSTFANSDHHRNQAGDPEIELAAEDAAARGLTDREWVAVENDRGRFVARLRITSNVKPGVAVATGIYWSKLAPGNANVNSTTSQALTDMGGGATFFDCLVQVGPQSPKIAKQAVLETYATLAQP